jgi:hypothetical protein
VLFWRRQTDEKTNFFFSKLFVNGGDSNCDYERAKKKTFKKIAKKKKHKTKPKHV